MTIRTLKWVTALHIAWFPVLFLAWGIVAGQSGSPLPDNWPAMARMIDIIVMSGIAAFFLLVPAALASGGIDRRGNLAMAYMSLLLLNCCATVGLCAWEIVRMAAVPAYVASPRPVDPCWRLGAALPAWSSPNKPIRYGDVLMLHLPPGSDKPLPDTPGQAAQRKAWAGRFVVVTGFVQGGALQVRSTGADGAGEKPAFCVWPDNVVPVRTH